MAGTDSDGQRPSLKSYERISRRSAPVLPSEWVNLVGSVVIWWGRIEGLLSFSTLAMRQHPDVAPIYDLRRFPTAAQSLIDEWSAARGIVLPAEQEKTASLTEALREVARRRHRVVHDHWPYAMEADAQEVALNYIKPLPKGGVDIGSTKVTIEELRGAEQTLHLLYHNLMIDTFTMPRVVRTAIDSRGTI